MAVNHHLGGLAHCEVLPRVLPARLRVDVEVDEADLVAREVDLEVGRAGVDVRAVHDAALQKRHPRRGVGGDFFGKTQPPREGPREEDLVRLHDVVGRDDAAAGLVHPLPHHVHAEKPLLLGEAVHHVGVDRRHLGLQVLQVLLVRAEFLVRDAVAHPRALPLDLIELLDLLDEAEDVRQGPREGVRDDHPAGGDLHPRGKPQGQRGHQQAVDEEDLVEKIRGKGAVVRHPHRGLPEMREDGLQKPVLPLAELLDVLADVGGEEVGAGAALQLVQHGPGRQLVLPENPLRDVQLRVFFVEKEEEMAVLGRDPRRQPAAVGADVLILPQLRQRPLADAVSDIQQRPQRGRLGRPPAFRVGLEYAVDVALQGAHAADHLLVGLAAAAIAGLLPARVGDDLEQAPGLADQARVEQPQGLHVALPVELRRAKAMAEKALRAEQLLHLAGEVGVDHVERLLRGPPGHPNEAEVALAALIPQAAAGGVRAGRAGLRGEAARGEVPHPRVVKRRVEGVGLADGAPRRGLVLPPAAHADLDEGAARQVLRAEEGEEKALFGLH
ncbi:unnamed protein product [Phytomonas sp. Hart1]|nr:unnamed protein product [Phytomonas sp. Hart1]|eukprot:CCW71764.1 unnamed protein product [Phytomonas sp. isolate Hart1]